MRSEWAATAIYGGAHYGKSLFWYVSELLFAFFLTEVAAIPANQMGLILALGLLVSAALNIAVGSRLSHLLPTAANAGRLQFLGAVASAVSMTMIFACHWLPGEVRLGGAFAASLAFRLSYALYDIPQNSLLSLATHGERARTNVAAIRYVFSGLAALTIAATLAPLLGSGAAADRAVLFCKIGAGLSVVAIASAWLLARAIRGATDPSLPDADTRGGYLPIDIRLLIGLMFVVTLAAPTFSKVEPYFAAFVLRDPLLGSGVAMAVAVGMTVAQPFWGMLAQRCSRAVLIVITAAAIVLAAVLFSFVAGIGGGAVLAGALAFGAAGGGIGIAIWASFADAVARHARGKEAWCYALFGASSKLSLAISGLALGLMLSRIDYRGDDSEMLVSLMVVPPVLAGTVCAVAALGWRLIAGRRRVPHDLTEKSRA
ncbi:MFS transporter [Novosphingobium album (ex Liu et al. 2023)]|uniref:MFS transporter n=1 Tax=Novosphingobium album (ex Liu et al. 2023) TaxID=3031130 RepID=A0ABT5WL16_9SPHN|nr:MFS transporter [Novosphingobium album (ex Liu et al. 2023)]MDE8650705.1 MFS transporter [Novosphingobium album (ex Liu et al. 2023)]